MKKTNGNMAATASNKFACYFASDAIEQLTNVGTHPSLFSDIKKQILSLLKPDKRYYFIGPNNIDMLSRFIIKFFKELIDNNINIIIIDKDNRVYCHDMYETIMYYGNNNTIEETLAIMKKNNILFHDKANPYLLVERNISKHPLGRNEGLQFRLNKIFMFLLDKQPYLLSNYFDYIILNFLSSQRYVIHMTRIGCIIKKLYIKKCPISHQKLLGIAEKIKKDKNISTKEIEKDLVRKLNDNDLKEIDILDYIKYITPFIEKLR